MTFLSVCLWLIFGAAAVVFVVAFVFCALVGLVVIDFVVRAVFYSRRR